MSNGMRFEVVISAEAEVTPATPESDAAPSAVATEKE